MRASKHATVTAAFIVALCWPQLSDAASLTFQWDPPAGSSPAGYMLFAGSSPGVYSHQIDVGPTTSYTLDGVPEGGTYYFAVAAYDGVRAMSGLSNEVSTTVPLSAPNPVTGLVLAPNAPSPQIVGTTVTWVASVTGGVAPYQYQWTLSQSGQSSVGPWTTTSSNLWTPTAAGDYVIRVAVRNAGSTSTAGDLVQSVPFTVLAVAPVSPTCTTEPPAVTLGTSTGLTQSVTVKNNNGASCAASAFALSAVVPTGWSASFSPVSTASLPPGASGSVALTLAAPSGTSGTYSYTVVAGDGGNGQSGSVTGSATVAAPAPSNPVSLTASVSLNNGRDRAATIKVKAKSGNQGVSGATIIAVITSPVGVVTTLNDTTDSSGGATMRLPLSASDRGTYQVRITASSNGAMATATTTFTVQ